MGYVYFLTLYKQGLGPVFGKAGVSHPVYICFICNVFYVFLLNYGGDRKPGKQDQRAPNIHLPK